MILLFLIYSISVLLCPLLRPDRFLFSIFFCFDFFSFRSVFIFLYLYFLVEFSRNVADAQPIRARRTRTVVSLQLSPIKLYDRYIVKFFIYFLKTFLRCTWVVFFFFVFFDGTLVPVFSSTTKRYFITYRTDVVVVIF